MESTQMPLNFSAQINETTRKHYSYSCYSLTSANFKTVSSTVPYAVNAALNDLLVIVGTFANILVFTAIRHSTSIRLPSKCLLCSLVLTDLGISLVAQPMFVTFLIAKVKESLGISCFCLMSYSISSSMFSSLSMLIMTAISLDRYIALFFHLKYKYIVTTRRVLVVLVIFCLKGGFFASTWFWNSTLYASLGFFGIFICFLVISVAYIKIHRGLRNQHGLEVQDQAQVQDQQQTGNTLDLAKYRRSASSMLWIYGLFILCYLPFFCVHFLTSFSQHNVLFDCILEFSETCVHLNSCLNPFVYCFRLPEIRAEVRQTIRKMCGQSPQQ